MDAIELEQNRRSALARYGLLDTAPEPIFDAITIAIANICSVPIALVSLVDSDRQWFKSTYGVNIRETPRDIAFCEHAIARPDEMMVVEDATDDPRFQCNPLVAEDPYIRFYAGKPIVTSDGYALGTLCVIDREPRQLLPYQIEALNALSKTVSAILDERHRLKKVVIDRDSVEGLVRERADRFQRLYEDAGAMLRGLIDQNASATVLINTNATIMCANSAWTQFSSTMGWDSAAIGDSYIYKQADLLTLSEDQKNEVRNGIKSVLTGKLDRFHLILPNTNRSWTIDVQPISQPIAGALIRHFYSS